MMILMNGFSTLSPPIHLFQIDAVLVSKRFVFKDRIIGIFAR